MLVTMMLAIRQRADKVSLSHSKLLVMVTVAVSFLVLFEPVNGQPNYYFKASAPAVKSLPRIGRRSDDGAVVNDDSPSPFTYWQTGGGSQLDSLVGSSGGNSGSSRTAPYLLAPLLTSQSNQNGKALLWRKLFGNTGGNNFDDVMLDSLYPSKS